MRRLCCLILAAFLCLALCSCNSYTIVVTDKDFQFPDDEIYSRTMRFFCDVSVAAEDASVGSYINASTLAERRADAFAEFLKTDTFYKHIAEQSGLGYSYSTVDDMIEISGQSETAIVCVRVTGSDSQAVDILSETLTRETEPFLQQYHSQVSISWIDA